MSESITDPLGRVTLIGQDSVGNIDSITNALGHTTQVDYNEVAEGLQRTLSVGSNRKWVYDDAGMIRQITDFNGNVTFFSLMTSCV